MSALTYDARVVCSASSERTMRTSSIEASGAQLTDLLLITASSTASASLRHSRTYTAACTGQRSINKRYSHAATRCNMHSYLHLTCCVCRRIQICSGCSRGRSSFQPAFCSVDDGRALGLHAAGMPGGRAHMPCMQLLRNVCCTRKAARPEISLASTPQMLHGNRTNS